MEDASAVDLDWFWRGWFFTNEHVDMSIDKVKWYQIKDMDPEKEEVVRTEMKEADSPMRNYERNMEDVPETRIEKDPTLNDFYTRPEERYAITEEERHAYTDFKDGLTEDEKAMYYSGDQFYQITFSNHGGLVMPLILKFEYADGSSEIIHVPAEIWKKNHDTVTKVFKVEKEAKAIYLDPYQETADVDMNNNAWPSISYPSRFELFKQAYGGWGAGDNEMQKKGLGKKKEE
jgi:hypothetical protein